MEINPRVVFERLFGEPGTPAAAPARSASANLSISTSITEEANALRRGLGARDRARLGEYLDNVREIERRIQRTEEHNSAEVTTLDAPIGIPESFEEHIGLMYDLMAVAYQTRPDARRHVHDVARAQPANLPADRRDRPAPRACRTTATIRRRSRKVAKINAYHARCSPKFLEKLRSTPDGDGSLLDHSLIFYGGGMGNPNQHASGSAADGHCRRGRARGATGISSCRRERRVGNLWLTVANAFDNPLEKFGESSGTVDLF